MGTVKAICISDRRGIQKNYVEEAFFRKDWGIEGDAHAGNWHRQVSLLGQESIDKMVALGAGELEPGNFAENITTEGITVYELPVGTRLKIGETLQEVTQIGKQCHKGCEIAKKVGDCVMPREGIFTIILKGGVVKPGDTIEVLED